jgi:hypothetical protein
MSGSGAVMAYLSQPVENARCYPPASHAARNAAFASFRATPPFSGRAAGSPPSRSAHKDDRDRPRLPLDGSGRRGRGRGCQDDVRLHADQLMRERSHPIDVIALPLEVHPHVAAPSVQPKSASACVNAEMCLRQGIVFVVGMSTPMRRTRSPCCAFAASGHAAAPPRSVMNSRRSRGTDASCLAPPAVG